MIPPPCGPGGNKRKSNDVGGLAEWRERRMWLVPHACKLVPDADVAVLYIGQPKVGPSCKPVRIR